MKNVPNTTSERKHARSQSFPKGSVTGKQICFHAVPCRSVTGLCTCGLRFTQIRPEVSADVAPGTDAQKDSAYTHRVPACSPTQSKMHMAMA